MYRLIACDLDETLVNSRAEISPGNAEAVRKAREAGVRFVPASGRGYTDLQQVLEALSLKDLPGEYTISFNGAALTENAGNREMFLDPMDFAGAEHLLKMGLDMDLCVHIYTPDSVYLFNWNDYEMEQIRGRLEVKLRRDTDLDFLRGQNVVKVIFMNRDVQALHELEPKLKPLLKGVDISYSANRYMEFGHTGVNKGAGLKRLCGLLGIAPEECIAIGDNWNDITMLETAGLGVAVNNAVPGVKERCGYVCRATCDEDAVAEVIRRFILKEL